MWRNKKFALVWKLFRENRYSVNLVLSQLISRNFWERIIAISTNCMTINLRKQAKMCLDIFHLFTNCIFSTSIYDLVLTYIMFVNFFTIFLSIKSRTIKILVLESWIPASKNFWSKCFVCLVSIVSFEDKIRSRLRYQKTRQVSFLAPKLG